VGEPSSPTLCERSAAARGGREQAEPAGAAHGLAARVGAARPLARSPAAGTARRARSRGAASTRSPATAITGPPRTSVTPALALAALALVVAGPPACFSKSCHPTSSRRSSAPACSSGRGWATRTACRAAIGPCGARRRKPPLPGRRRSRARCERTRRRIQADADPVHGQRRGRLVRAEAYDDRPKWPATAHASQFGDSQARESQAREPWRVAGAYAACSSRSSARQWPDTPSRAPTTRARRAMCAAPDH
jgi:hypothetical protein